MLPDVVHSGSSLIGVCISISLALNVQKLAHHRLARPAFEDQRFNHETPTAGSQDHQTGETERTALLVVSERLISAAATASAKRGQERVQVAVLPPPRQRQLGTSETPPPEANVKERNLGRAYLSSKLWWLGMILLVAGETGNFASYGFAPASVVAPLGSFALISNCFLAPWILKEQFRWRDLQGIVLCILGALVVVISSNQSDVKLDPDKFVEAVARMPFVVYASATSAIIVLLAWLSARPVGERFVVVDLGVCALTGGFTVLSAKALASFLQLDFFESLRNAITWAVIGVLASTAIVQVNFLNKALARFDSRLVVPAQFVLFTVSALVGSAVLFREFDQMTFSKALNFFFGCSIVFVGVYVLTRDEGDPDESGSTEEQGRISAPLHLTLVTDTAADIPTKPLALASRRIKRTASGLQSAPRSMSASAGYLLIASPASKSPQICHLGDGGKDLARDGPSKTSNYSRV